MIEELETPDMDLTVHFIDGECITENLSELACDEHGSKDHALDSLAFFVRTGWLRAREDGGFDATVPGLGHVTRKVHSACLYLHQVMQGE